MSDPRNPAPSGAGGCQSLSILQYTRWRESLDDPSSVLSVPGVTMYRRWQDACALAGLQSGRQLENLAAYNWQVTDDDAVGRVEPFDTDALASEFGADMVMCDNCHRALSDCANPAGG